MSGRLRGGLAGTLLAAALLASSPAQAATPELGPLDKGAPPPWTQGYKPIGPEERGLWLEADEAERQLKNSNFILRDAALNAYVKGVLCRTVGEDRCQAARIYIMRTPFMNASMAPNGMMQVWTGLLLRVRDEAQLSAVLAHEFGHFEHRDTLRLFRDMRGKTDAMAWLSFIPYVGTFAQFGMIGSIYAFNRDMEREADIEGLGFMVRSGYSPHASYGIWTQFRAEMDATAVERKQKSRKDRNGGFFATHPNTAERVQYLTHAAKALPNPPDRTGIAEYRAAMANWWAPFIDDQVKLNDFGATEFLLSNLARDGSWSSELLYARGELYRARGREGDFERAADFYRKALAEGSTLPEARRGLGLALLRTGGKEEARLMLRQYMEMKPDAVDRSMMAMLAGGE